MIGDRVKETSATTGTGTWTLAGAASGQLKFSAEILTGGQAYYVAADGAGNFEEGIGTLTIGPPDFLTRDIVIRSTNGGGKVSFTTTVTIRCAPTKELMGPIGNRLKMATTTGSANAYVLTLAPAMRALVHGARVSAKASFANTGAATLNVNGTGAKAIRRGAGATAIALGDIPINQVFECVYDSGQDVWQLTTMPATAPEDGLYYVPAWLHGVPGDGTDQTAAMQAIVDALPATGGVIAARGLIYVSALDLHSRVSIKFLGMGTNGGGGDQRTELFSSTAATRIIDARDSVGIEFEDIYIRNTNASFTGILLDLGKNSGQSAYMGIRNSVINAASTSATLLRLEGGVEGNFSNTNFGGGGAQVKLSASVACTTMAFRSCAFGFNTGYAVQGSGGLISFKECIFEPTLANTGRALQGSSTVDFHGLTIDGCGFYDCTVGGFAWVDFPLGVAFNFVGNVVGGPGPAASPSNYGISLGGATLGAPNGGVRGFKILGNSFEQVSVAVGFAGTKAAGTGARSGVIGGNFVAGGATPHSVLVANIGEATVMFLPNEIEEWASGDLGRYFGQTDMPSYSSRANAVAGGLQSGDSYRDSGTFAVSIV